MTDINYHQMFEVPYLSGCCMVTRSDAFCMLGGFDERYSLYLEDADITRSLAQYGLCVHLPVASIIHVCGRGNYSSFYLMCVNVVSMWRYFQK